MSGPDDARDRPPLAAVVAILREFYGPPGAPSVSDPFAQILLENVAYLSDEARRAHAFRTLERTVGLRPEDILSAGRATLERIVAAPGRLAALFAGKLIEAARIALGEFQGDLDEVVRRPLPGALRALRRFPGIGEPGAEKILLFSRAHPVLGLDSNGVRTVIRLGLADERKQYAATYAAVRAALAPELPTDFDALIEAQRLLTRHGRETCRSSAPDCRVCPLRSACAYARRSVPPPVT